jgi:carbonic anhydrase
MSVGQVVFWVGLIVVLAVGLRVLANWPRIPALTRLASNGLHRWRADHRYSSGAPADEQTGAVAMIQSNFATYIERNESFAATDAKNRVPRIPFIPNRQLYLITCIDPRVEPAAIVGLELGEAIVARNIGGRATPAIIKDMAWILHLHENLTPDADWFEIAVIHHNDCGTGLFAKDELRAGYVARGGWDDETASAMAVLEPAKTVTEDVQKLRTAAELQPTIGNVRIGGYTYDLDTGKITTVVEPS